MTDAEQARLTEAYTLMVRDEALRARSVLDGMTGPEVEYLRKAIEQQLSHLASRDAFQAFYEEQCSERPFLPEHLLPVLNQTMPRCQVVRERIEAIGARRVLELGCFDGFILLHLGLQGVEGMGVDVAAYAIQEATARAQRWRVPCTFRQGFAEDIDLGVRFDAVLLLEVLEHVIEVEPVLAAAERHLAPGGEVIVSVPLDVAQHPHYREQKEHVRRFDAEGLRAMFRAEGRREAWYCQYQTPDGMAHVGSYRRG